jgi:WD40 repeat protein
MYKKRLCIATVVCIALNIGGHTVADAKSRFLKRLERIKMPQSALLLGWAGNWLVLSTPSKLVEVQTGDWRHPTTASISANGNIVGTARRGSQGASREAVATYSVIDGKWTEYADTYETGSVAISPDGSTLAYNAMDELGHGYRLHIVDLATRLNHVAFAWPDKMALPGLSWSPNGKRLLYIAHNAQRNDRLEILDIESGEIRTVSEAGSHSPWGSPQAGMSANEEISNPAWSPSGEWIAYISKKTPLQSKRSNKCMLIRPDGSGVRVLTESHELYWHTPVWSPDSTKLFLTAPSDVELGTVNLLLVDVDTATVTVKAKNTMPIIGWVRAN